MIKRFNETGCEIQSELLGPGRFVLASDYDALAAELAQVRCEAALRVNWAIGMQKRIAQLESGLASTKDELYSVDKRRRRWGPNSPTAARAIASPRSS